MKQKNNITSDYVRLVLDYNPVTDVFTWRKRPDSHFKTKRSFNTWNARFSNRIAGSTRHDGYRAIIINNRKYFHHRLVWLITTGEWPVNEIDHKDGNPSNNSWVNLREVTHAQNMKNRKSTKNKSGWKGVTWNPSNKKWHARITVNGKVFSIGLYNCPTAVHFAYCRVAKEKFGEFARVA